MELLVSSSDGALVKSVPLLPGVEVMIGRDGACSVVLAAPSVSRSHAIVRMRSDGVAEIEDNGSSHGTFVNGTPLRGRGCSAVLTTDAAANIGGFILRISEKSAVVGDAFSGMPPPAVPPPRAGQAVSAPPVLTPSGGSPVERILAAMRLREPLYSDSALRAKSRVHKAVISKLNASGISSKTDFSEDMDKVAVVLDRTIDELTHEIPNSVDRALFREALLDDFGGYGPINPLLKKDNGISENITEVMVNAVDRVFVEISGKMYETNLRFADAAQLLLVIQKIVAPLGRHIDSASPMVDARLPDGSRVNAIIPPLALDGPSVTIRKFSDKKLTKDDLIRFGSMTPNMALFLEEAVRSKQNILISGGTGSGKTSLLNVLSLFIPSDERVVTIEDAAELKLTHRNIVRLEARPANIEGKGRIAIRDLVVNALRMRPDRIIVGECRGSESLDMLQAMNTGHDGSLTTLHANNPRDALSRLETMVMMAGFDLPSSAIREQIASAINIIVQQNRLPDGSRKVLEISEVTGRESSTILMQPIFKFEQKGIENGKIVGRHIATGNVPKFVSKLREAGDLRLKDSVFSTEGKQ